MVKLAEDHKMRACLALITGLLVCAPAYAAGGVLVPTDQGKIVVVGGELVPGDDQRFKNLIASVQPDVVVLDRPYGRADVAVLIAAEIRKARLNTFIPGRHDCGPSCAFMFLAGQTKYAVPGARISVTATGSVTPAGDRRVSNGAVLEWLGMPDAMRVEIASEAADQLYWISEKDKAQLGIVTVADHLPAAVPQRLHAGVSAGNAPRAGAGPEARTPRARPSPGRVTAEPVASADPAHSRSELPGLRYLAVPDVLPPPRLDTQMLGGGTDQEPARFRQAAELVAAPPFEP